MLPTFALLLGAVLSFLAGVAVPPQYVYKPGRYIAACGENTLVIIYHVYDPVRKAPRARTARYHNSTLEPLIINDTIFLTNNPPPFGPAAAPTPPTFSLADELASNHSLVDSTPSLASPADPPVTDPPPIGTGSWTSLRPVCLACGLVMICFLLALAVKMLSSSPPRRTVSSTRMVERLKVGQRQVTVFQQTDKAFDRAENLLHLVGLVPPSGPFPTFLAYSSPSNARPDPSTFGDGVTPPHESGIEGVPVSSAQVIPPQPASAQNLVAPPAPPSPPSPARLPITPALCGQPLPTEERLQERPNPVLQILDGGHLAAAVADVPEGEVESPSPPRAETRAPSPAHRPRNASPGSSSSSRPLPPLAAALEAETSRMTLSEITPQPPRPDPSKSKLPIRRPAAPSAPSGVRPGRENVRPVLAAPSQGRALAHKRSTAEEGVRSGRPSHRPTVEETKARRDASGVRPAVVQGRPALSHRRSTGEVAGRLGLASHRTAVEEPQADGEGDEREHGTSQKLAAQVPAGTSQKLAAQVRAICHNPGGPRAAERALIRRHLKTQVELKTSTNAAATAKGKGKERAA